MICSMLEHLNLLNNTKSMCDHLIAGVFTDELVEYIKGNVQLYNLRNGNPL